jgi:hypothetical protein
MNVVFADDSFAFDGYSPSSQPLDGPAKGFASLPTSLAMRGHVVVVVNRCAFPVTVNGARWLTWDGERPTSADVLIAFQRPQLLDLLTDVKRRILWISGAAPLLDTPEAQAVLIRHRPLVIFSSRALRERWANPLGMKTAVIEPGIAPSYLEDDPMMPAVPPRAICTAHPLAGVGRLLNLWTSRIRAAVPNAELHLYSMTLDKGQLGGAVSEGIAPGDRRQKSGRGDRPAERRSAHGRSVSRIARASSSRCHG